MDSQDQQNLSAENPVIEKTKKEKSFLRELIDFLLIAILIVLPFRLFVAQPFVVNGASMEPTFDTGDYLIVDQLTYHFKKPERGSVMIFKYPKDTSKYFIKRVIGLPGETISIKNGSVSIKNDSGEKTLDEPYIQFTKQDNLKPTVLGDNEYFVLGDNRIGSADSRIWGAVPKQDIIGRPILRLLPISKINFLPGDERQQLKAN